jgi:hypothetical protein
MGGSLVVFIIFTNNSLALILILSGNPCPMDWPKYLSKTAIDSSSPWIPFRFVMNQDSKNYTMGEDCCRYVIFHRRILLFATRYLARTRYTLEEPFFYLGEPNSAMR